MLGLLHFHGGNAKALGGTKIGKDVVASTIPAVLATSNCMLAVMDVYIESLCNLAIGPG